MERRNFFNKLLKTTKDSKTVKIIRPPYISKESDFALCSECDGKCALSCEEDIIVIQEDKTPCLDFSNSGCTFCDKCAEVCEKGVLKLEAKSNVDVKIEIDKLKCMSWSKNICFSCKDPCLDNAIEFSGMFYPEIIAEKCTSCGFCIKYCPTEAIKIVNI
jgi:ferredoxin-type protein NapF